MKKYAINEDLRNDLITYINNSNSKFDFNLIEALKNLVANLPELPSSEEVKVVVPEVVSE